MAKHQLKANKGMQKGKVASAMMLTGSTGGPIMNPKSVMSQSFRGMGGLNPSKEMRSMKAAKGNVS